MNPSCFSQIYLCLCLPSNLLPLGFLNKTYTTIFLILLDLTTLLIFGVKHKPWKSLLCSPLQSPVTSSSLGLRPLKRKVKRSFEISATSYPAMQHHIPEYTLWRPWNLSCPLQILHISEHSHLFWIWGLLAQLFFSSSKKSGPMEIKHSAILVQYLSVSFPFTTNSTFCNIMTCEWVGEWASVWGGT